jgi:hypothetical protein
MTRCTDLGASGWKGLIERGRCTVAHVSGEETLVNGWRIGWGGR